MAKWFMAAHGNDVIKTFTATLSSGAATIADTSTTAGRSVRIRATAPAGTVGALFHKATTAGTSFQVASTSSTDTSVVLVEVLAL